MPEVPAFCDTCGTPFRAGITLINSTVSIGKMSVGPCPSCGGRGTMSNVVFSATEDAIRILFEGPGGRAQVERLRTLIERVQQREATPEQLVAELEQGGPTWKKLGGLLSKMLVPTDSGQFYGLLALILAALPLLQQPKEELTKAEIASIVATAVQKTLDEAQPTKNVATIPAAPASATPLRIKKKPGRNDPCQCSSGKKFKHCCGGLASR